MNLSTQSVILTGASRGIGRALIDALCAAGVPRLYAIVRSDKAAADLTGLDSRIVPLIADVTDRAAVARLAEKATEATLLINNAGVLDFGSFLENDRETVERNFATNFYGKLNMIETFAPVIEANGGGTIVNVLTLVALASMPSLSVYNASKAATWSMTQSVRASLAPRGIKVVGVFPGAVDTDMLASVDMPKTPPRDIAHAIVDGLQEGREDIFPDPMSTSLYDAWKTDHKAVERQFASM